MSTPPKEIRVWVHPKARQRKLLPGPERWEAWVPDPPEKGQATAAVQALLAEHLGLPTRCIQLIRGATHREKVFRVLCPPGS